MQRQGDLTDEEGVQKPALPSKKLKRPANKASLECVKKRKVEKACECECECECDDVHDEGDVLSEQSCRQVVRAANIQHQVEPHDPQCPVESLQSWDYFNSESIVPHVDAERYVNVSNFDFDPIRLRRELAKMIVLHEYPLSMVDHIGFRDFLSTLNPLFKIVSQNTVENDIMKIFKFERNNACIELSEKSPTRVAITTKMWTSNDGSRRFLAITGHMINHRWKREPYIMRFANVPFNCKDESICKVILDCFSNFKLEKKLSTITVDSYTSDDKLIDILAGKLSGNELPFRGKLFRLPCFAHTMSLMVQDGFEIVRHVIEKVRDSIVFWTASPKREMTFEKTACKLGVSTPTKVVLDHGLSWSSTYLMLQDSLSFEDVFYHLGQQVSQYDSLPSKEEWDLAREVCTRLKILYDQMKHLVDCPASCMYFKHMCEIKVNLLEWLNCEVPGIKEMASKMVEKFDKYWLASRDILGVATVFHPKYRFFPVKHYFPKIYGSEAETETDKIHQIFYALFREYKSSLAKTGPSDEELRSQLSSSEYEFRLYLRELEKEEPDLHEVDLYLKGYSGRETEDSDILSWWEGSKSKYHVLHKMAQDILAIPIFAVDVEDAFVIGDKILGANRSRLPPTMVEALICTQRWVRIHKRSDSEDSFKARKHTLGTIYDDTKVEHGIIIKAKSAEAGAP